MKINPIIKPLLYLAAGASLLGLVSFMLWVKMQGEEVDVEYGRVAEVTREELIISDKRGERTTIALASTTVLWRGKDTSPVTSLSNSEFVQVWVAKVGSDLVAKKIHVMRPPREAKELDSNELPAQP